jgi:hypothetical protein
LHLVGAALLPGERGLVCAALLGEFGAVADAGLGQPVAAVGGRRGLAVLGAACVDVGLAVGLGAGDEPLVGAAADEHHWPPSLA